MIIFSDVHLKADTADTVFGEVFPGLLEMGLNDPDKHLVCLGDFWHIRYKVEVRLQNRVAAWLDHVKRAGLYLTLLAGNHDQINTEGESALDVFFSYPNVRVVTSPGWDHNGLWIPYRKNVDDIRAALQIPNEMATNKAPRIAFMHHGIQGAIMNDGIVNGEGVSVDTLQGFDHVICGHYHNPHSFQNVTYIGSPYQTRASESGQTKRVGVWKNSELSFLEVDWGKRYVRYEVEEGSKLVPDGTRPGDELRITAKVGVDPEVLAKSLSEAGYKNVIVTPEVQITEQRLDVGSNAGLSDFIVEYVSEFCGDLQGDRLMDVYGEITHAAK